MRAYVTTTGIIFGLLTLIHIWRAMAEDPHLAREPSYLLITTAAAVLSLWAFGLLWRRPRSRDGVERPPV